MANITPKEKMIPSVQNWNQNHNYTVNNLTESLGKITNVLSALNCSQGKTQYDLQTNSELLNQIIQKGHPLRSLLYTTTDESLSIWEIYNQYIIPLLEKKYKRSDSKITSSAAYFRTIHIHDTDMISNRIMYEVCNRVKYLSKCPLIWKWMATHHNKLNKEQSITIGKTAECWHKGVDGNDTITTSNLRAWKNHTKQVLKAIETITADTPDGIIAALILLTENGSAVVKIEFADLINLRTQQLIYLASQCFTLSYLHQTRAGIIYFVGTGFYANVHSKLRNYLLNICGHNTPIFVQNYEYDDGNILNAINNIINQRIEYYEKLSMVYEKLSTDGSAAMFNNYANMVIDRQFPDGSKKWSTENNCPFFN